MFFLYIYKYKVTTSSQCGFWKHKSTEQVLLDIKDKIIANIESKLTALVFLCTLKNKTKKTSDTLQHEVLLQKLDKYGTRGIAHKLVEPFYRTVLVRNCQSNIFFILKYTAWSSPRINLTLLTIFIYINDLTTISGIQEVVMYADDSNIFFSGNSKQNTELVANPYLLQLSQWLQANRLQLNSSKTRSIILN